MVDRRVSFDCLEPDETTKIGMSEANISGMSYNLKNLGSKGPEHSFYERMITWTGTG